jgi:hypothetical protein
VGFTRDFKPAGSMLRNPFGSHVPSDLLLLEDALGIEINKNILVHWQHSALKKICS